MTKPTFDFITVLPLFICRLVARLAPRRGLVAAFAGVLLLSGAASGLQAANANFVHKLFSSNMVLQRDAVDPVWGWTTAGNTVTVTVRDQTSATIQTATAVADANGRWQTAVGPFALVENNAAYSMTVSASGETLATFTNILIGDVWLCSGQSNMEYTLSGLPVYNLAQEVADSANYPQIRHFLVAKTVAATPQTTIPAASWSVAGPSTTGGYTATGYFTAREIYKQQGVPIGILSSSWAGTTIKVWTDPDFAAGFPDFAWPLLNQGSALSGYETISGLYNAMMAPLAPFSIKGAMWYQGEFDYTTPEQYSRLLPALMSRWRTLFAQPELPFLIVQLPNITNTGYTFQGVRETEFNVVKNDPHSRLVTTIDIGGPGVLHPWNKQDLGLRAAWAAADLAYGQDLGRQAPLFTGAVVEGSAIRCSFSNVGPAGLMAGTKTLTYDATARLTFDPLTSPVQPAAGGTLTGFTIAGANQVFVAATAVIDNATNTVVVSSPSVTAPVHVQYAWDPNPAANLYNKVVDGNGTVIDGVPASPFRTNETVRLVVNTGDSSTGTSHVLNTQVPITAPTLSGQPFDYWSGDTGLLSSGSSESTVATVAQTYVSVLANYVIPEVSSLTAVRSGNQIRLSWGLLNYLHYNVRRATSISGPYTLIAANLMDGVTSFIDPNVEAGVSYYYTVSGLAPGFEGPPSATVFVSSNQTPTITSSTTATGTVGSAFSYQVTVSNGPTSYDVIAKPDWMVVNTTTGQLSGTPTSSGVVSVTLSATNNVGTGTKPLSVLVPGANVIFQEDFSHGNANSWTNIAAGTTKATIGPDPGWFGATVWYPSVESDNGSVVSLLTLPTALDLENGPISVYARVRVDGGNNIGSRFGVTATEASPGTRSASFTIQPTGSTLFGYRNASGSAVNASKTGYLFPSGASSFQDFRMVLTKTAASTMTIEVSYYNTTAGAYVSLGSATDANFSTGLFNQFTISSRNAPYRAYFDSFTVSN